MELCMVGVRGHYGYVLQDLAQLPAVRVLRVWSGTAEDCPEPLGEACPVLAVTPARLLARDAVDRGQLLRCRPRRRPVCAALPVTWSPK